MPNLSTQTPEINQQIAPSASVRNREELRDLLRELAWTLSVTCSTLDNYLLLRQDFMVGFSVRQLIGVARALREAAKLLEVERRREDER
jgi:hypothetical protein